MLEQTVNTPPRDALTSMARKVRVVIFSLAALALSACMPQGEQNINTELFKNKEDMKVRTGELKPGMSKKAVFERLGIKPEKFEQMNTQEMQMSVYGNFQVQGTPEQLEKFKHRMLAYEGFSLPYRKLAADGSLGFGKMKIKKTGYDLRLVLIFEDNRLLKAAVEGTQEVRQEEDQYLWDSIIKKGIGFAF